MAKADYDHAIADFNEALKLAPERGWRYLLRGRANLYAGSLSKALSDINQASELDPNDTDIALWLDIVSKRSNLQSRLSEATKRIDMTKWPAPIVCLFLGQLTPEAVIAAADDPDADEKKQHLCEANFYSGQLALQQGAKDRAASLFKQVAADCKAGVVGPFASAELKALGMQHSAG